MTAARRIVATMGVGDNRSSSIARIRSVSTTNLPLSTMPRLAPISYSVSNRFAN